MRLIDADDWIEAMKKTESEHEKAMTCPSWWSAFNVISEQPTAYSVDKVVDELEEKARTVNVIGYGTIYEAINKDVAIEIVKQGDVNDDVSDDVCEWKVKSNYYVTECSHDTDVMYGLKQDFKFCPYCSKKIKVVE